MIWNLAKTTRDEEQPWSDDEYQKEMNVSPGGLLLQDKTIMIFYKDHIGLMILKKNVFCYIVVIRHSRRMELSCSESRENVLWGFSRFAGTEKALISV